MRGSDWRSQSHMTACSSKGDWEHASGEAGTALEETLQTQGFRRCEAASNILRCPFHGPICIVVRFLRQELRIEILRTRLEMRESNGEEQ